MTNETIIFPINNSVKSMHIANDHTKLFISLDSGIIIYANAYGDCCSYSWIEHISGVKQILGSPITDAIPVELPELDWLIYKPSIYIGDDHYEEHIQLYGTKLIGPKGAMFIEYRNSSNGYYGGSLDWYVFDEKIIPSETRILVDDF
jgi:hypothetical protein